MEYNVGYKIGNIEVVEIKHDKEKHRKIFYCKCLLCGNIIPHRLDNLLRLKGNGCKDCVNKAKSINSLKHTRLYNVWRQMKHRCRCTETDYSHWKNYRGRGIDICKEWETYAPFKKWAEENGWNENTLYKSKRNTLTIDRIDNNGNYCPENCRIITHFEQQWNKRINIKVEYNGKVYNLLELSNKLNLPITTIIGRIKNNRPLDEPYKFKNIRQKKEN